MKSAVYCRTRGTVSSAMLGLLARVSAKPNAAQTGQHSPSRVRLDPTTDVYRTTFTGAL
jgi:hypothetical protein